MFPVWEFRYKSAKAMLVKIKKIANNKADFIIAVLFLTKLPNSNLPLIVFFISPQPRYHAASCPIGTKSFKYLKVFTCININNCVNGGNENAKNDCICS